ncbi:sensor histidine kinase [Mucilaginibacter auburnensis]|uniref:Histidine kinase n=1 Tax=Mucilaginibacter auburnensis TaxID=1457233 RepID=A0A2H9VPI1_9SPHI|nr:sensor histidine kinase [Mucilaginibacter auburnensis]PJJ80269.1 histidine kinase [Mucilaginibacter auburnensis]
MKKGLQIFWHIFIWLSLISFFLFLVRNNARFTTQGILVIFGLYGLINISLFYLNYLVLIPRFLNKKQYALYAATVLVIIIGYGFAKYGVGLIFPNDVLMRSSHEPITFGSYFVSTLLSSSIFIFLSVVLKFSIDWFLNERIQRDLENQRLTAELAFLKSQINPHFLFNSLNSIYSLAYQHSENTPGAILKLSEIMRYMLYESNDNKVALEKELQYLQNYIDLQKIRFGDKAFIDFKIQGEVGDQRIVPLLLIAFIENAFKHGVANDAASAIKLLINIEDSRLYFYIKNKKHANNRDAAGGIGLGNVKRRLDLLYPGKYNLEIRDEIDSYTCELSLVL